MGAKRKSGTVGTDGGGKAARKGTELPSTPTAALKQEHLKLFSEWLTLSLQRLCAVILMFQCLTQFFVSVMDSLPPFIQGMHRWSKMVLWTHIWPSSSRRRTRAAAAVGFLSAWQRMQDEAINFYKFLETEFPPETGLSWPRRIPLVWNVVRAQDLCYSECLRKLSWRSLSETLDASAQSGLWL